MSRNQQDASHRETSLEAFACPSRADRRRVPAWLLSCLLHAAVLLAIAMLMHQGPRGAATESPRSAGIVLVQGVAGQMEYLSEDESSESPARPDAATETSATTSVAALPTVAELPIDVSGVLPSPDGLSGLVVGGEVATALPNAAALTSGTRPSKKLGRSTKTYIFGAEGEGSVFVYVFDRSDSMNGYGGLPLAAAKAELLESLRSLKATHQFQIMFYNAEISVFNPYAPQPPRVMFADDKTKVMAEQYVRAIRAFDGTRHLEPLRLALRLAPDVIFFLTDAADPQLTPRELAELERLNAGTVIHAIEFGTGPFPGGGNFLVQLARQSRGQHVYVDVSKLGQ
jgi:hypothetical protein